MNRAERRARDRWQEPASAAPLDAAMAQAVVLSEAYSRFAETLNLAAATIAAQGGPTPAQNEALDRWAMPTAAAFRRATADMDRLRCQLAGIACLDSEG